MRWSRCGRGAGRWQSFAVAVMVGACAQASPPPGGTLDRSAPRIVETQPAQGAIVPGFDDAVVIKFDETISERGPREAEMISVSPETGIVDVDRDGSELKVKIAGGWQTGVVYHVTVLPGLQDRRGNPRADTYELVFSTGPEILPTVVGGLVEDRLTKRPVANARVLAVSRADSAVYSTVTDSAGFFAFRSLPLGAFDATAFLDANRNRELDGREARDIQPFTVAQDTPVVQLSLLAPDTTPARLLRATARDSQQVRVAFDDFIAPDESLAGVTTGLWLLPDSLPGPSGRLIRIHEFDAERRVVRDSVARPPIARGVRADTISRRLPSQELVFAPATPLRPQTRYRITITGIRNIAGVPGGGGSVVFETPEPPRAPPVDTTRARVPSDTTRPPVPADTTGARLPANPTSQSR